MACDKRLGGGANVPLIIYRVACIIWPPFLSREWPLGNKSKNLPESQSKDLVANQQTRKGPKLYARAQCFSHKKPHSTLFAY